MHRAPIDLNKLVEEAVEAFEEQARERGVTLELSLAPELKLTADGRRIIQVMFNLLSNALKFTPRGGQVLIRTEHAGDMACVRVTDTGAGIGPDGLGKLFQPFSQAHDPAHGAKGTGLGLFICRGIVEQHGGHIVCSSEGAGKGTTFVFTLPLTAPTEGPERPVPVGEP